MISCILWAFKNLLKAYLILFRICSVIALIEFDVYLYLLTTETNIFIVFPWILSNYPLCLFTFQKMWNFFSKLKIILEIWPLLLTKSLLTPSMTSKVFRTILLKSLSFESYISGWIMLFFLSTFMNWFITSAKEKQ